MRRRNKSSLWDWLLPAIIILLAGYFMKIQYDKIVKNIYKDIKEVKSTKED